MDVLTSMHSFSNVETDQDDVVIVPATHKSIPHWQGFMIYINFMTGVTLVNGFKAFTTGLLIATLINVFFAVISYFTCILLIDAVKIYHETRLVELWKANGFKLHFIVAIFIFFPCLAYAGLYYISIRKYVIRFKDIHFGEVAYWITDPYFVGIVTLIVFVFPVVSHQGMKALSFVSVIGFISTIVIFILSIVWFVQKLIANGFDPNHQIVAIDLGNGFFNCVTTYIGIYFLYMIQLPVMIQQAGITIRKAKTTLRVTFIYFCLFMEVLGLIQYFTVYNQSGDIDIFDLLPNSDISVMIAIITMMVKLVCSISVYIYPAIESLFYIIVVRDNFPQFIWFAMGVIACLTSLLLSIAAGFALEIIQGLVSCLVLMMQYIFPTALVFRHIWPTRKLKAVLSLLVAALGAGITIYSFITTVQLF